MPPIFQTPDPISDHFPYPFSDLAPVVQKVDSAIHWINHYPVDNAKDCVNTYPVDSAIHLLNNQGLASKIHTCFQTWVAHATYMFT